MRESTVGQISRPRLLRETTTVSSRTTNMDIDSTGGLTMHTSLQPFKRHYYNHSRTDAKERTGTLSTALIRKFVYMSYAT